MKVRKNLNAEASKVVNSSASNNLLNVSISTNSTIDPVNNQEQQLQQVSSQSGPSQAHAVGLDERFNNFQSLINSQIRSQFQNYNETVQNQFQVFNETIQNQLKNFSISNQNYVQQENKSLALNFNSEISELANAQTSMKNDIKNIYSIVLSIKQSLASKASPEQRTPNTLASITTQNSQPQQSHLLPPPNQSTNFPKLP